MEKNLQVKFTTAEKYEYYVRKHTCDIFIFETL
jgi:hypothetical protein